MLDMDKLSEWAGHFIALGISEYSSLYFKEYKWSSVSWRYLQLPISVICKLKSELQNTIIEINISDKTVNCLYLKAILMEFS